MNIRIIHSFERNHKDSIDCMEFIKGEVISFQLVIEFDAEYSLSLTDDKADYYIKSDKGRLNFVKKIKVHDEEIYDIIDRSAVSKKEKEHHIYIEYKSEVDARFQFIVYNEKERVEKTLEVRVYPWKEEINPLAFDFWIHPTAISRYYKVQEHSEEHIDYVRKVIEKLSECSNTLSLVLSTHPWDAQGTGVLYEENFIRLYQREKEIYFDFSFLDKVVEIGKTYGFREYNIHGLIGNWNKDIEIKVYDEDKKEYFFLEDPSIYYKKVFQHLKELDILKSSYLLIDEPKDIKKFVREIEYIRQFEDIKIKTAIDSKEHLETIVDYSDSISMISSLLSNDIKDCITTRKPEIKLSYYICYYPEKMNTFLKSPLSESRILGWLSFYKEVDTLMRWAFSLWDENVMNDAAAFEEKWPAGDMFLIYPLIRDSLRYKNLKLAATEFGLLTAFSKKLGRDKINKLIEELLKPSMSLFKSISEFNISYEDDYRLYRELLIKIYKMYEGEEK